MNTDIVLVSRLNKPITDLILSYFLRLTDYNAVCQGVKRGLHNYERHAKSTFNVIPHKHFMPKFNERGTKMNPYETLIIPYTKHRIFLTF